MDTQQSNSTILAYNTEQSQMSMATKPTNQNDLRVDETVIKQPVLSHDILLLTPHF